MQPRFILRRASGVVAALAVTLAAHTVLAGSGQVDASNRFPNAGAWVVVEQFDQPLEPFIHCSGVLIHPRVFLTAGHCTAQAEMVIAAGLFELDDAKISFGVDAFDPSTWAEIAAIVTHPGFSFFQPGPDESTVFPPDLGVVILKEPVNLPCATLPYEGFLDDLKDAGLLQYPDVAEDFAAVGYGNTVSFPPSEEHLADGLRRFGFPDFHALRENLILSNQNQAAGNTGLGSGDSGGPLYWIGPGGESVVVAVHSGTTDPERASMLADFRIDTALSLDFIDLVIEMIEAAVFD